ncbi:hypothetical protein ACLSZW_05250 [Avibacterium avium]|uniref:hypothetical protein n=1 Tax=Avibacterium avium TaxID=751 RepID=UPI003BF9256C
MKVYLNNGREVQIVKLDNGFQAFETLATGTLVKLGITHRTFQGVLEEILMLDLTDDEENSIKEMQAVVTDTCNKVLEYFQLNSEYLAHLEQPSI